MATKIAYKVMPVIDGQVMSGRNKNLGEFDLSEGSILKMPGQGIFMAPDRQYVLDHYSGLADEEVLLTLRYDPSTIIVGNLDDREPEITVPAAKVIDIEYLVDGELQPRSARPYQAMSASGP